MLLLVCLSACEKNSNVLIPDNRQPDYSGIPTIKVENYINRLFIDLLGREATDTERIHSLLALRNANLSQQSRINLIRTLQHDSTYREGDSSYKHAYYERIYNLMKARFLEGADDGELRQNLGNAQFAETVARLNGDSVAVFAAKDQILRYENVLKSRRNYRLGQITFGEMCSFMMNNGIYDIINMNSFNFINASYDDLFNRLPTKNEFDAAYEVIEFNRPANILGRICTNKIGYCKALTESNEFYEAQVRWAFYTLLQREPTVAELSGILPSYRSSGNLQQVQLEILKSDEYAQFR